MTKDQLSRLALALTLTLPTVHAVALDTEKVARDKYDRDLRQVQSGDLQIDWKQFRLAAEVAGVAGDFDWHPVRDRVLKQLDSGDYKAALDGAQQVISHNFAEPEGHLLAMMAYRKLDQPTDAANERQFLDQIVQSILKSGDGKTAATAYFTVNIPEEYFMIHIVWGSMQKSQALVRENGHSYDAFTFDDRNGVEQKVIFNTDTDMQRIGAALSAAKKK